jgi:hypothetical protein
MALVPIKLPPGVFRNGTELQASGRWYDANLVRWFEGTLRPMGGWLQWSSATVSGVPRGMFAWRDNSTNVWLAVGSASKLYVYQGDGDQADITPTSFSAGRTDATGGVGYGNGDYGEQAYGTQRLNLAQTGILPATTWSMDNWGQYLVACSDYDGKLYEWQLDFATPTKAVAITNAPTSCKGLIVSEERFLFALGAGGDPRKVQWSDQEDNTVWTPAATNQAGDFILSTPGSIVGARRVRGGVLILTDVDAHFAQYQGPPYVYGFERVGTGCGLVSAIGVATADTFAAWMGQSGFWMFDGYTKPLPSDVSDYVFNNINRGQISKVSAVHNSKFAEIWWFYPSGDNLEIDSYVIWNYRENHWSIGSLVRTVGTGQGVFSVPLMAGSDGKIYQHETGWIYSGAGGSPYAESGPYQIGMGDNILVAKQLIPDENTLGDVTATFKTRLYPTGDELTYGPYSLANPTSIRLQGRQMKVRVNSNNNVDWRVGVFRFDAQAGSKR